MLELKADSWFRVIDLFSKGIAWTEGYDGPTID